MDLIADTSFLVGLWRRQPWAIHFARESAGRSIGLPRVVLGEFWHGANRAGHTPERVRRFLDLGIPMLSAGAVYPVYASVCATLQERGVYKEVGQNDLWIAAVALEAGRPLVTRNLRHFGEVEGLDLHVLEHE